MIVNLLSASVFNLHWTATTLLSISYYKDEWVSICLRDPTLTFMYHYYHTYIQFDIYNLNPSLFADSRLTGSYPYYRSEYDIRYHCWVRTSVLIIQSADCCWFGTVLQSYDLYKYEYKGPLPGPACSRLLNCFFPSSTSLLEFLFSCWLRAAEEFDASWTSSTDWSDWISVKQVAQSQDPLARFILELGEGKIVLYVSATKLQHQSV